MTDHDLTDTLGNRKAFAERLKVAIAQAGRTQEVLASDVGLSLSGFRKWLYGDTEPQMSGLVRAADALGVTIEWLATGVGPMRPGEAAPAPEPAAPADTITIDPVLFGRCLDAINKLFQELNIKAPSTTLGEEAALIYQDVAASGLASLEEQLVAIRALIAQRRRALLSAPPSKQQGSA